MHYFIIVDYYNYAEIINFKVMFEIFLIDDLKSLHTQPSTRPHLTDNIIM